MPREFAAPDAQGPIRQGEVLFNVWEHRSRSAAIELEEGSDLAMESFHHPYVVVVSPECDLLHDFAARFPDDYNFVIDGMEKRFRDNPDRYLINHTLLCEAYNEATIRTPDMRSDIFRRVKQNQDERYHHIGPAPIVGGDGSQLDIFIDFKSIFSLPSETIYLAVRDFAGMRLAVVPPIYVHDLIHRCYAFQSRVALPD